MRGQSRRIKGVLGVFGIALIAIVVVAIYKYQTREVFWSEEWEDSYCSQFGKSYTSGGVIDYMGSYIYFCDNQTKKRNLICVDQNCSHKEESGSSCGAYIDASVFGGVALRGNHLLYIANSSKNYDMCSLYSADLEGKNRKKIADFIKMDMIFDVLYHQNMVFISYYNEADRNGEELTYGIYAYDFKAKKAWSFYEKKVTGVAADGMALSGNSLYVSYVYPDATKEDILKHKEDEEYEKKIQKCCIVKLNLEDGSLEKEIEGFGNNNKLLFVNGNLFYSRFSSENQNWIVCYEESQDVSQEIEKNADRIAILGSEDDAYFQEYDSDLNKCKYFLYDIKEKKWKELGAGKFIPESFFGDYVYGYLDGELSYLKSKDFYAGDTGNVVTYNTVWKGEE